MVSFARRLLVGLSLALPLLSIWTESFAKEAAEPQASQAGPAQGQAVASGSPEELIEIQVTGTQIISNGFQAPTPVTVFSADELMMSAPRLSAHSAAFSQLTLGVAQYQSPPSGFTKSCAQPPIGDLRWKAPQPAAHWHGKGQGRDEPPCPATARGFRR